ncbi:MAG: Lin0512 family protein [Burkholderiaceae bacterium]
MKRRIILEMGMGNDLHGEDYTKAALRAVQDALHHSSLSLFRSLDIPASSMEIDLTLGAARPERIDLDKVAASLPFGTVRAVAEQGGLDHPAEGPHDRVVVVTAAIAAWVDIPEHLIQGSA